MPDNMTFIADKSYKDPLVEIPAANFDVLCKVIKRIGIFDVQITGSILNLLHKNSNEFFAIFKIDVTSILGEGVNINFHIENSKRKMLGNIKGNDQAILYDKDQSFYLFSNGIYTCPIPKIKSAEFHEIIPVIANDMRLETNLYREFKKRTGKVKYVDIYILNKRINSIIPSNSDVAMSFDPLSTIESFSKKPDRVLRSFNFFRLDADETTLMIFEGLNFMWLCTRINFTDEIVIDQYEPLQVIQ